MVLFWGDTVCRVRVGGKGELEAEGSVSWGALVPSDTPSYCMLVLFLPLGRSAEKTGSFPLDPRDPLLASGHCDAQGYWPLGGNSDPSMGGSEGQPGH